MTYVDDDDYKVSAHTSPAPEETVFFEPFADLDLTMGEEGRTVQAEARAAIQMVLFLLYRHHHCHYGHHNDHNDHCTMMIITRWCSQVLEPWLSSFSRATYQTHGAPYLKLKY